VIKWNIFVLLVKGGIKMAVNQDVKVSDICRELLLDKKNRSLLINSDITKNEEFIFLHEFATEYLDKDSKEIDVALELLDTDNIYFINDMLQGLINLCKAEWIGDNNPVEIITDPSKRKKCSLCGAPNNKWVYNIKNKINKRKMNVGSTCIGEFPSMEFMVGKTRSYLEKEAEKKIRLKDLTLRFHGIERIVSTWTSELDKYSILIPYELETPYLEVGDKIKKVFDDFINKKVDENCFSEIEGFLNERDYFLDAMREYEEDHEDDDYIASRKVVNWLYNKGDLQTIESLKSTGYITYMTATSIYEKSFLTKVMEDLNFTFEDTGVSIAGLNEEYQSFIIKPFKNEELKLYCSYQNFISYFGWSVFGEKQNAAFNLANLFKISRIRDRRSIDNIISNLKNTLRGTTFSVSTYSNRDYDYFTLNELDIFNKKTEKYTLVKLREFVDRFKSFAYKLGRDTVEDIIYYLEDIPTGERREFTRSQLRDLRTASKEMDKLNY
jgi:hypothetical protein